jgi:hypothetical protein
MNEPRRLVVEYEDGSTKGVDISRVGDKCRSALVELGLCPPAGFVAASKNYVVLQWAGWQEVLGLDAEKVELLRYYIIRRIEDLGRLSFQSDDEIPELFTVRRRPRELKGILVAGPEGMRAYDFSSETERWEGIFETGGKIEYVKYDKADRTRQDGLGEETQGASSFRTAIGNELARLCMNPNEVLAQDEGKRIEVYGQIAKGMGLRGGERQADVYGLIELLVKQLAS